jgi:hypothetical protein
MNMTADVADVVRAEIPWANLTGASPLLDIRQAAGRDYNASGRALMNMSTFRLLEGNANPRDLWGRRYAAPGGAPTITGLFRGDDLPVPALDRDVPAGRVVLIQGGLPALTIDVGG